MSPYSSNLFRYSSEPADPSVKGVSHDSRALNHVTATKFLLNNQEKVLRNILSAIVDQVPLLGKE